MNEYIEFARSPRLEVESASHSGDCSGQLMPPAAPDKTTKLTSTFPWRTTSTTMMMK
jgi:hypothetical protein